MVCITCLLLMLTGFILSSQMVGYSVGKLLGGLLVDLFSPSRVFIITLVLAAFSVVAFTGQ